MNYQKFYGKKLLPKSDKKSQPILFLASENNNIFVADTAANYYVVDDFTGDLKWKKTFILL